MNKFVMLLVALMVTLFGVNAMAFTPPDAPAKGWYVVDKAGKLSQSEIARLNQKIEQVSRATKNEFGVLVLDTMDGGNIEDAAYDTFKKWGVGKHGLDNGVLVVISVKERKSRIETGKGVGGEVPDIKAKEILDMNLAPHLKRGDFYGGLDETLSALSSLIESRHNEKVAPRPTPVAAPTHAPVVTTSNPVGVTPPTSTPRTNNGGCATAPVGTSTDGNGFFVMVVGLGLIFLGGWFMARRARNKEKAAAREEQARQVRILAQRKLQQELEAAARERDRVLNLPTPAVAVPSVRPVVVSAPRPVTPSVRPQYVAPLPPPPVRHAVSPLPIPRPAPRVEPVLPKVEPRPVVSAPTTVVAAGAAIAAAAAATALRRKQEEVAAEERRVQEAGEENRRRQARREAEAEEDRREEERREARRQQERDDEERRAQARREEEERYEARRREQEEDDRRRRDEASSYSSYDSGSSSSDSDSGGGFGGGDSGGGGASSDW